MNIFAADPAFGRPPALGGEAGRATPAPNPPGRAKAPRARPAPETADALAARIARLLSEGPAAVARRRDLVDLHRHLTAQLEGLRPPPPSDDGDALAQAAARIEAALDRLEGLVDVALPALAEQAARDAARRRRGRGPVLAAAAVAALAAGAGWAAGALLF